MQWEAPALVVAASPYGESSLIVSVMTQEHGLVKGLAKGARSRQQMAVWQLGNVISARWSGRLVERLGVFQAECLLSPAAYVLDHHEKILILSSCCALVEKALPEREVFPRLCEEMKDIFLALTRNQTLEHVRKKLLQWELHMLEDLGYGLSLQLCTLSGVSEDLLWVSPRTGCAVSDQAAGVWKDRLLPLPSCLRDMDAALTEADWCDGLRLTGHFLHKNVFGVSHLALPHVRVRLYEHAHATLRAQKEAGG